MIEEVLSLGVKGDDLVLSQLQKIQEQKEKFERPSNVSVTAATQNTAFTPNQGQKPAPQETKAQGIFKGILDAVKGQKETLAKGLEKSQKKTEPSKDQPTPKPEDKKEDTEKKKSADSFKEVEKAAMGAVQGLATLSAGGALQAAAKGLAAIPIVGDYAAAAGTAIVGAAQAFRDNVRSAASINFNTAESESRIANIAPGSSGRDFIGRVDIDLNSQRALAEAMAAKFGTVQKPLQDAIKEVFANKNGRAVDATQAAQLSQGNFNALGSDKGFFLQKIQDQLGSLPPTLRQGITAGLLSTVKKSEQDTESSTGARQAVTTFDNQDRDKAKQIATPTAIAQATEINDLLNTIDGTLNQGFSSLLNGLNVLSRSIQTKSVDPLIDYARNGTIGRP